MSPAQAGSAAPADAFLRMENLVKQFGEVTAVQDVSLTLTQHEIFAWLGSSGCGKSTLLRMLAGFEAPTSGRIYLDGQDITALPPHRRPVNMMFQSYALCPHMTVQANVAFGLKQEGVARDQIARRVREALALVQMQKFAERRPHQLSGGQQQRVALARSLVKQPKLLLLDEPLSALDRQIRQQTQLELLRILGQVGVTCIMVTHDQDEAMTMAHRLGVMTQGRIVQTGAPQAVYDFPETRFVAGFIGSTNLYEGVVAGQADGHVQIESEALGRAPAQTDGALDAPAGAAVALSIRPERVRVRREPVAGKHNWARGVVSLMVWMGSHARYQVRLNSGQIMEAQVPRMVLSALDAPGVDDEVFVSWDADAVRVLVT
jgi:putrescine transport system ATP-binding protein